MCPVGVAYLMVLTFPDGVLCLGRDEEVSGDHASSCGGHSSNTASVTNNILLFHNIHTHPFQLTINQYVEELMDQSATLFGYELREYKLSKVRF